MAACASIRRALLYALTTATAACSSGHQNHAPTAVAAAAADASFGEQIQLDGSASADPEGSPLAYEWTQLAGPLVTLTGGALAVFTAPDVVGTLEFRLVVSDDRGARSAPAHVRLNVLRNREAATFVARNGDDANLGTREAPLLTIGAAITAAAGAGDGAGVYVAEGRYEESLDVPSGVALYGGYDAAWTRTPATTPTVVAGGATAVSVSGATGVVLDGLEVESADAAGAGGGSIALRISGSQDVTVRGCRIAAGAGGAGSPGGNGLAAAGAADGSPGANGGPTVILTGLSCPAGYERIGGAGGAGPLAGGAGGASSSSGFGAAGDLGTNPGGGAGGIPGTSTAPAGAGQAGTAGAAGAPGAAGSDFGALVPEGYLPSDGGSGDPGSPGGGGGGGAGGSVTIGGAFGTRVCIAGGSGGGGGAGGPGGDGAGGGRGGGGSFGIVLTASTGVVLADLEITTGTGGAGGAGGEGGTSAGGAGAPGGRGTSSTYGFGGDGGAGGDGGRGGAGGGGGGGPSICILRDAASSLDSSGLVATPGVGGAGGASTGIAGATGASGVERIE